MKAKEGRQEGRTTTKSIPLLISSLSPDAVKENHYLQKNNLQTILHTSSSNKNTISTQKKKAR
jgi:hypothetical protein